MNKRLLAFVFLLVASIPIIAQDYEGSMPEFPLKSVPSVFTLQNKSYVELDYKHYEAGFVEVLDSLVLYDNNLQRVKAVSIPVTTYNHLSYTDFYAHGSWTMGTPNWREEYLRVSDLDYVDLSIGGESIRSFYLSQTLFNNDSKFEYVLPHFEESEFVFGYGNYNSNGDSVFQRYHVTRFSGFDIMNEEGELVSTIRCSDEENIYNDAALVSWDGKFYLAAEVIHTDHSRAYNFYRIDRQTQKIEQVASVPFNVRPTLMERGQEIIVELDENTIAREIDVVNTLGQTVKRVPLVAGQREVRINSADLGSGMNFINTRTPEGQGTVKIIVK